MGAKRLHNILTPVLCAWINKQYDETKINFGTYYDLRSIYVSVKAGNDDGH